MPKVPNDLTKHNCIGIRQGEEAYGVWRLTSGRGKSATTEAVKTRGNLNDQRAVQTRMKVKARDKKVYDVGTAPPGGTHEVHLDGALVGSFVLEPKETVVTVKSKAVTEVLLVDIADRLVPQGGKPTQSWGQNGFGSFHIFPKRCSNAAIVLRPFSSRWKRS